MNYYKLRQKHKHRVNFFQLKHVLEQDLEPDHITVNTTIVKKSNS